MRRAGILLTALALLAVQAPWVACACSDDAAFAPLLVGGFGHVAADASGDASCCAPAAHIAHGRSHGHGCAHHDEAAPHCHGRPVAPAPADEPTPSDHVAFRLPASVMTGAVALPAPAVQFALLAILSADTSAAPARRSPAHPHGHPPVATPPPCIRTEHLRL